MSRFSFLPTARAACCAAIVFSVFLFHPAGADTQGIFVPTPDCNCDAPKDPPASVPSGPTDPIWGYADLHSHQFGDLGFGGLMIWGDSFGLLGDTKSHLPWGDFSWKYPTQSSLGVHWGPFPFAGYWIHGPGGVGDLIGTFVGQGGLGHKVGGYPYFDGWPKYNDVTHQQEYYQWLYRSFLGGQKLQVVLAVNNEVLCGISNRRVGFTCDDMDAVDLQLAAAKTMEFWIDYSDDFQLNGTGWYQIAYSPQQARTIIDGGNMAAVLGIEVDTLFDCGIGWAGTCTEAQALDRLQNYYDQGVRHVFPVHLFDNGIGGTALANPIVDLGNFFTTGTWLNTVDCSADGVQFELGTTGGFLDFIKGILSFGTRPALATDDPADGDTIVGHCNPVGLSNLGEAVIDKMMDLGMIIDIDHMSTSMFDRVVVKAKLRNFPLVSSHTGFRAIAQGQAAAETQRTDVQIEQLRQSGGMVAPALARATKEDIAAYGGIVPDCDNSSKTWAQLYLYAVDRMKPPEDEDQFYGVGFGSDFNGFLQHPGPRDPCKDGDNIIPTADPLVQYPFRRHTDPALNLPPQLFDKQIPAGNMNPDEDHLSIQFDINQHGLTNVGMLPDFIEEMKMIGITDEQLEPLFRSAEAYIRVWESAVTPPEVEPPDLTPPVVGPVITGLLGNNGWYLGDVTLTWSINDPDSDITGTSGCGDQLINSDTGGVTFECSAESEGGKTRQSVTIKRDTAPPLATLLDPPSAAPWYAEDVVLEMTVQDLLSGTANVSSPILTSTPTSDPELGVYELTLSSEGAATSGSVSVTDVAGNPVTFLTPAFKIDKTPPTITASRLPAANNNGWNKTDVTVSFSCSDDLSGVSSCDSGQLLSTDGAGQSATGTATDVAGNTTSATLGNINIDTILPTITGSASPDANPSGWNNTDVTVSFACSDPLSGLDGDCGTLGQTLGEGVNQSVTQTVTDRAGNQASDTVGGVNVDQTAPTITASRLPLANENGWNNSDVTVSFVCDDTLPGSGVSSCGPNQVLSVEGPIQSATGTVDDVAGNTASVTLGNINIDKTAPILQCNSPDFITPPDAPVTFVANAIDNLDPGATAGVTGFACVANNGAGKQVHRSCEIVVDGSKLTVLDSGGVGDVISWSLAATDLAGNPSSDGCTLPVIRPNTTLDDRQPGDGNGRAKPGKGKGN